VERLPHDLDAVEPDRHAIAVVQPQLGMSSA
jgi:hypothetical protein